MLEPRLPIGFDIQAKCVDYEKDIWEITYIEEFRQEDKESFEFSLKMMRDSFKNDGDFTVTSDDNRISIYVKNKRTVIFSMLAAEFMGNSAYGKMTMLEILTYSSVGMMRIKEIQNEHKTV